METGISVCMPVWRQTSLQPGLQCCRSGLLATPRSPACMEQSCRASASHSADCSAPSNGTIRSLLLFGQYATPKTWHHSFKHQISNPSHLKQRTHITSSCSRGRLKESLGSQKGFHSRRWLVSNLLENSLQDYSSFYSILILSCQDKVKVVSYIRLPIPNLRPATEKQRTIYHLVLDKQE